MSGVHLFQIYQSLTQYYFNLKSNIKNRCSNSISDVEHKIAIRHLQWKFQTAGILCVSYLIFTMNQIFDLVITEVHISMFISRR